MSKLPPALALLPVPLHPDHEQEAIRRMTIAVAAVRGQLDSKHGYDRLETLLMQGLREGRLPLCAKAVEAAVKHEDSIADRALRAIGAELQTALIQKRDLAPGHLQIIAYYQAAGARAPHKRKPGRYGEHDQWYRNVGICILIRLACAEYGVQPTRAREARRASRQASGCSLVAAALAGNKLNIEEKTIQQHIWYGVWGDLVRQIPDSTFLAAFSAPW